MIRGTDILDSYYSAVDKDPRCRNIKNAQRQAFQGGTKVIGVSLQEPTHFKKLSLQSILTEKAFSSYLERTLDTTIDEFKKVLKLEIKLHKFALKHDELNDRINVVKKCLFNRKYKLIMEFKDFIPSNLVTKWIYWNKCVLISYSLDSILLMQYDTFIVIYDLETSRKCIYRTNLTSQADIILLVGSKAAPVFAFAERGIYRPKIFVIGYHELQKISQLYDAVNGAYVGMGFSLKKILVSAKVVQDKGGLRMVVWNWTKGQKIVVYEQDPCSSVVAHSPLFHWDESLGSGVIMRRDTTYNDQCQLVNVLKINVFKQKLYEEITIIYKMEETFNQSIVPKEICTVNEQTAYVLDEKGDLYAICMILGSTISFVLKKKWQLLHKRPKCPVRLVSYRNGFLIYGPEGVLKRYYQDKYKEWHCSWWMDLFDYGIKNMIVFGKPEYLYAICPLKGILRLNDEDNDNTNNNRFETIFKFEKNKIRDIIVVQPACRFILAICDRRNIFVLNIENCKQVAKISFPEKFDKFPYLANPYYPYIIFISDRVGIFYIYDIEDYESAFVAAEIFIGPHRITYAEFAKSGLLLYLWIGSIGQKMVYWAVNKDKSYKDIKIIFSLPSEDNLKDIVPYVNTNREFFLIVMEKKMPKFGGNRVFIYKMPMKRLVGVCTLDNNYTKLYFSLHSVNWIYGALDKDKKQFVRFTFIFKKTQGKIDDVKQSINNMIFTLGHEGEIDLVFSCDYTFIYGLTDGLLVVLDLRDGQIKKIYSGFFHRGALANYESNKYVGGGIKKCFGIKCGKVLLILGRNGTLTGHKFRKCRLDDTCYVDVSQRVEMVNKMRLLSADSCMSVSLATKKYPLNNALLDTREIVNTKDKEQPIKKGSKWAHCYATQFTLTLIPSKLSSASTESLNTEDVENQSIEYNELEAKDRFAKKKEIEKEFMIVNCALLKLFREYYRRGRMTLPFPLFIISRDDLKQFFRRLKDIEAHTEANMKRRMVRVMQEAISWIKVFRDPFNNARLIRGILNPEIKAWTVGTKILRHKINWRRLCEKQWDMRKVLGCGYKSINKFPVNPALQKRVKVSKQTFPDISYLNTPEVLYVTRKTVGGFKESDMRNINKVIQEAAYLNNLRAAIEFYTSGCNIEGVCNSFQSPVDYKSLWQKLCTKDTYRGVYSFNQAIDEVIDNDKSRGLKRTQTFLKNLLESNHGRFFEIKDNHICRKCKKVPLYSNCSHKPKCFPCFHDLKCTLSKYIFPESTRVIRAPDVSPDFFCKPMKYMNYYRFILHPHVKCCSFDPGKGFEVSSTRTDEPKDKQLQIVQTKKPKIIKNALSIVNKKRELPPKNFKLFSKTNHEDIIWDESLEELIKICSASTNCELLLRKLFFKCSQRLFCHGQREYILLKSLKHLLKYTSFFPLHTYLALPWLRDLVKEVTDLKNEQDGDYKKVLKLYPEILTYKKTEYHDPLKIPGWWYKFMKMIAEARKSLNHKLAKVYVMTYYEEFFPEEAYSDVSSEDSVDSDIAKSPADVICGYEKIPCHQITDVGLNEEIHRYGQMKVRKKYPASERLTTRTYDNTFKKQFMEPLEKHYLFKWRNTNQLYNNPRLTMSLTRYDDSKYKNPDKEELSSCSELEKLPDCITKRKQGTPEVPSFYLNKGNLLFTPNAMYKVENSIDNTETMVLPIDNNYRAVPVTNISDPFVPVQPHHPHSKYWRPFTLKWLLSMKRPFSPRLLTIVQRLVSHEIPSEVYDWFKTYSGLIHKIQRVVKNRLLNYDLKKINKLQYHEYTKIEKLVYPIKLLETAQWLALIIHKLSIINKDVIESTEKIMSKYCNETIYKKHPLHLPKGRYPIKGKSFDPRKAFKLVVGQRFTTSSENPLIEDLNKTNQLAYNPKMYEPQQDLRRFLAGPVNNAQYVLKLLINRQMLQMCASKSNLHNAPKDWFTWRPLQQGAPNWVLMITVAFASKLFCCTLSNITRRLYKILRDSRKYVCRKAAEQSLKKRVNVEDVTERDYEQIGPTSDVVDEKIIWEQPDIRVNYPSDNSLTKYTGSTPRNENNLMAWRKHEEEFLGRIQRRWTSEKERMEIEIDDMLKADEKGWQMYLEHKRYWTNSFKLAPLQSGFPPIFDKKNRAIIEFGTNYHACLGENQYEICQNRAIKDTPKKLGKIKEKKDIKGDEPNTRRLKKKAELLFMKKLILNGPTARYTTISTYYANRFEHFTPMNSGYFHNVVMLTVEKLSKERDRILGNLRTMKHHIVNFMLLMHIKREHIKKKLSYFCECDDYYMVHYKRQMKLKPDEKLNYLYEVDDEDNMFYRNGKLKAKTDPDSNGIIQPALVDDEPFLEKELKKIMGGTQQQNYLTTLKEPFLRPPCFHNINELNKEDRRKIEKDIKKSIILEKERDLTVMEFKRQMGWFSVYKEWFKWSFDYILAYHGVFQLLGIENAIKAEEVKYNHLQKVKWEIRKIITVVDKIRISYMINITEYLYARTIVVADIDHFRDLHANMLEAYQEIEKINTANKDLKIRILRENPYLKESSLDSLLSSTISMDLLKNVSAKDLITGYKFYYLRKKSVYHYYQLNPQIGNYYEQVRSLNDERLYPIMSLELRRELIELRTRKQLLNYQIHTGQKKIEEFYDRLSKSYTFITAALKDMKQLHQTCFRKLNLLKGILDQTLIPVSVSRKQLDQPLWKLVKPYTERKDVRFVAIYRQDTHPQLEGMQQIHRFIETLLSDRLIEIYAIRKTLTTELKLRKLYLKLLKIPAVRFLDGAKEDMIQHYKDYNIKKSRDVAIPTKIKAYDKVLPEIHLTNLISNYVSFVRNKKCFEFGKEKSKKKRMTYSRRAQETPPACRKSKIGKRYRPRKTAAYGALAWYVKSSWEISDFTKFFKPIDLDNVLYNSEPTVKTGDSCALLEHSNKVYDFLRIFITPPVPPPSPAGSQDLCPTVKMMAAGQGEADDVAYQQDEIILNYLKNQIQKFAAKLEEKGKTYKDISPRGMENLFQKWINKLFSNWQIRVPTNLGVSEDLKSCSLLLREYAKIQTHNINGLLFKLIENHARKMERRNIERVPTKVAFTEHDIMLRKCVEHMSTLYPPMDVNERIDECSGTERGCNLSVYAKFGSNVDFTLSEEQYLLILNLLNEHMKKYNKDTPIPDDKCSHVNINKDLFKDGIEFAFEKIFLNPVQYVFIKAGERLLKMYDNLDTKVQIKRKQTKKMKAREMITSYVQEYRELDGSNINLEHQLAEEERIKLREPLLFKWTSLKRELEKLRQQNKRLEIILAKEMKKTYPVFGEQIVPLNEKLGNLMLDSCSSDESDPSIE